MPTAKACKECRRLRLACDREIPCHSCRRRGCSEICPDGTLEKGARPRSTIIFDLQETIAELRNRNYLLEEALRKLQATTSSEPHPLLQERTPSEKTGGNTSAGQTPPSSDAKEDEISNTLNNFHIVGDGEFSLHGPTASAEYLVKGNPALLSDLVQKTESPMSLPPDIILLSALFPFSPDPMPIEKLDDFVDLLPPYQTTLTLSQLYFQNIASCVNTVPYDSFAASVLTECYPQGIQVANLRHISPHILSILFMICAMGSLADINNSRRFVEAEEYHTIARAVLCLRPIYEYPTIHATQSMSVMLLYHQITERRSTGYVMALWSVLARMCEMSKLNYDQQKIKKDSSGELREIVFWEIMYVDSWYSFVSGRDRSIKFNTITCKKPLDPDQTPGGGYETWKYRHASMLDNAVNRAFREKGSTYSLIQELDNELRNVYCPHSVEWPEDTAERAAVLSLPPHANANAMQRYLTKVARETGLLHLHRWFFQQAIQDNQANPFQHPFGFSVKATLKASCEIIHAKRDIFKFQRVNIITLRFMWLHTYSAAMVLGTFISLFPILDEAVDALPTFDCACDMFISMEEHRVPSLEALHVLQNLQSEAHRAMLSKNPSFSSDSLKKLGFWTNVPNPYSHSNSPSPLTST